MRENWNATSAQPFELVKRCGALINIDDTLVLTIVGPTHHTSMAGEAIDSVYYSVEISPNTI